MKLDCRTTVISLSLALMIGVASSGCGGPSSGSQAAIPEEVQKKTDDMLKKMQKDMAAKHANDPKTKRMRRRP